MNSQSFLKILVDAEHSYEKKRTTALARAQWATAIELDAKLDLLELLRKQIADEELRVAAKVTEMTALQEKQQ